MKTELEKKEEKLAQFYLIPQYDNINEQNLPIYENQTPSTDDNDVSETPYYKYIISQEANWMIMNKFNKRDSMKNVITKLLSLKIKDNHSNSFITNYYFHYYNSEMSKDDAHELLTSYHSEYYSFLISQKSLIEQFDFLKGYFDSQDYAQEFINEFVASDNLNESDLKLAETFFAFLKEKNKKDVKNLKLQSNLQMICHTIYPSIIEIAVENKIHEFTESYVLNISDCVNNLKNILKGDQVNIISPPTPNVKPVDLARNYLNPKLQYEIQVMTLASRYYALSLSVHPFIKKNAFDFYLRNSFLSTSPTEKGEQYLDSLNEYYRCKRIKKRPISTLLNLPFDDVNGDLYTDLLKMEKEKMIEIEITVEKNSAEWEDFVINKLSLAINGLPDSSEFKNDYDLLRSESIRMIMNESLKKEFLRYIKEKMKKESEAFIRKKIQLNFRAIISTPNEVIKDNLISLYIKNRDIYAVVLSGNGEVFDKHCFQSIVKNPSEDEEFKNFLNRYDISKVIFNSTGISFNKTKAKIKECLTGKNIEIDYVSSSIPKIYAKLSSSESGAEQSFYNIAASQGRFYLSNLNEILHLWYTEKREELLEEMNLHKDFSIYNKDLKHLLENEIKTVLCERGVLFDKSLLYSHLKNNLYMLFDIPEKENLEEKFKNVKCKQNLENTLDEVLFKNENGFVFFSESDYLENTRINCLHYPIVLDFVKLLLGIKNNTKNINELVNEVIYTHSIVLPKDKEEVKKMITESGSNKLKEKIYLVLFIYEELCKLKDKNHSVTEESMIEDGNEKIKETIEACLKANNIRKNMFIYVKILKNQSEKNLYKCQYEKGSFVMKCYLPYENSVSSSYPDNTIIKVRVESIEIEEKTNKLKVYLSNKNTESVDSSGIDSKNEVLKYFDFEAEDFKVRTSDKKKLHYIKFPPGMNNINLKNISYKSCTEIMKYKNTGDYVFRPSFKGDNYITLTYLVTKNIFRNVSIKQNDKPDQNSLGRSFEIEDQEFKNLNEIIKNYLTPITTKIKEAFANKKFFLAKNINDLKAKLLSEKESKQKYISYYFSIFKEYPQYLVLGYSVRLGSTNFEYAKINNKGFVFHGQTFETISDLNIFFRNKFGQRSYLDYAYNAPPPEKEKEDAIDIEYTEFEGEAPNISNIRSSNIICNYCKEIGHFKVNCPKREERSGYIGEKRPRSKDAWGIDNSNSGKNDWSSGNKNARGWGSDNLNTQWEKPSDTNNNGWGTVSNSNNNDWGVKLNDNNGWKNASYNNSPGWGETTKNNNTGWGATENKNNINEGWGTTSNNNNEGWGASKNNNEGWGTSNNNNNTGWGETTNKNKAGWGEFSNNNNEPGWGKTENKNNAGWGTTSNNNNDSGWGKTDNKNNSGWGTASNNNNDPGWGTTSNKNKAGWGTVSNNNNNDLGWGKTENKNKAGWGETSNTNSDLGWGTTSNKNKAGWGETSNDNNEPGWGKTENKNNAGWGETSNNNNDPGWGKTDNKSNAGWGETSNNNNDSGWGKTENKSNAGWGETSNNNNAGWGTTLNNDDSSWGTTEKKNSNNAGWGATSNNNNEGWGTSNNNNEPGWGETSSNNNNAGWGEVSNNNNNTGWGATSNNNNENLGETSNNNNSNWGGKPFKNKGSWRDSSNNNNNNWRGRPFRNRGEWRDSSNNNNNNWRGRPFKNRGGWRDSSNNNNNGSNWEGRPFRNRGGWRDSSNNNNNDSGWEGRSFKNKGDWKTRSNNNSGGWRKTSNDNNSGWGETSNNNNAGWGTTENKNNAGWGEISNNNNAGWGTTSNNNNDSGWGTTSNNNNDGWGASNNNNEGWGTSNNNNEPGWGETTNNNNAGWGAVSNNNNAGWGTTENKNNSGWGETSNNNNEPGWGATLNNKNEDPGTTSNNNNTGWGETSNNNNAGWGTTSNNNNDSGWGTTSNNNNEGWGTTSNSNNAGWGTTSNNNNDSGWGTKDNKNEDRAATLNSNNEGWGTSNNNNNTGWGETSNNNNENPGETSKNSNAGWGATLNNNNSVSLGESESKKNDTNCEAAENKNDPGWGEVSNNNNNTGWGETSNNNNENLGETSNKNNEDPGTTSNNNNAGWGETSSNNNNPALGEAETKNNDTDCVATENKNSTG